MPAACRAGQTIRSGARALYIYQNGRDTLLPKLHGTNENWSIGQAVSSGCVCAC